MMPDLSEPVFLFLGDGDRESARSTLKNSGIPYVKKMLNSSPGNWDKINQILSSPSLIGTIVKLSTTAVIRLFSDAYSTQAEQLLEGLAKARHVIFVHESLISGEAQEPIQALREAVDDEFGFLFYDVYQELDQKQKQDLRALLDQGRHNFLVYKTNAELSMSATNFVQENDKRLLFRVYLPKKRLWAEEADKLLGLFRDWLAKIKGHRVRQGGYSTAHGDVYEFYATDELVGDRFSTELEEFSSFLDICIEDPELAISILENSDIDPTSSSAIVSRYGKEARRLKKDIKQSRETKLLTIRHRLENELEDSDIDAAAIAIQAAAAIPLDFTVSGVLSAGRPVCPAANVSGNPQVVINQKIVNATNSIVAQEVSGNIFASEEALQLSALIAQYAGVDELTLQCALHELEDSDADITSRVTAKQRIRTFLAKVANKISGPTIEILQKYIENKLGL